MAEVKTKTLRVKLDTSAQLPGSIDISSWKSNALDVEVGIYDAQGVSSISDVQSINCKVQASQLDNTTLMDSTVASGDMDSTLDDASWEDGSKQHATFSFTNAQTNLTLNGTYSKYWVVFTVIKTDGDEVTLAAGSFTIHEDNNAASAGDPDENPGTAITLEQADARYASGGDFSSLSADVATNTSDIADHETRMLIVETRSTSNTLEANANTTKNTEQDGRLDGLESSGFINGNDLSTARSDWAIRNIPSSTEIALLIGDVDTVFRLKLDHDARLNVYNPKPGAKFRLEIEQGATGGIVETWGKIRFGTSARPTLQTVEGAIDLIEGYVDAQGVIHAEHRVLKAGANLDYLTRGDLLYAVIPDEESTVTKTGDDVTAITGFAGTASSESLTGTATYVSDSLNGVSVLQFNGTTDGLTGGTIVGAIGSRYPLTLYLVARPLSFNYTDLYFTVSEYDLQILQDTSLDSRVGVTNGVKSTFNAGNGTDWFILSATFTGTGLGDETFKSMLDVATTGMNHGTWEHGNRGVHLGAYKGGSLLNCHCEIAAALLYENADTESQQDQVVQQLCDRLNIDPGTADILPAKDTKTYVAPPTKLVAHRGGCPSVAPENTEACWLLAQTYKVPAIEVDVQLSSDGVPFLLHDIGAGGLDATTDVETVFPGRENDEPNTFTWAELQQLDAGSWKDAQYTGEKIPSLVSFLKFCALKDIVPVIDDKVGSFAMADAIESACEEAGFPVSLLYIHTSRYSDLESQFRGRIRYMATFSSGSIVTNPTAATDSLIRDQLITGQNAVMSLASINGAGVGSPGDWDTHHDNGLSVIYYLAPNPTTADTAIANGFDAVWTDHPQAFVGTDYLKTETP